jgi:hypothetical protein
MSQFRALLGYLDLRPQVFYVAASLGFEPRKTSSRGFHEGGTATCPESVRGLRGCLARIRTA